MTGSAREVQRRVLTIDAIRGVGLLTLIIGSSLVPGIRELPESMSTRILSGQLQHAEWHGFTFYDWGTQTFVMALGMSAVASATRRIRRGEARSEILLHALRRSALLFLIGLVGPLLTGGLAVGLEKFPLLDILQSLAICIFASSLVHLTLGRALQALLLVSILLGNWAVMELVPAPGFGGGDYGKTSNVHGWVANQLTWLGRYSAYQLTALPGMLANAIMGLWIGELLLKQGNTARKLAVLGFSGLVLLVLAYTIEPWNPFNKRLWTTSYILVSAGWMCLAVSVLYLLTDLGGFCAIFFPFVVVGRHSLLTYASFMVIPFGMFARLLIGDSLAHQLGRSHLLAVGGLKAILCWLFVYGFDRQASKIRKANTAPAEYETQAVRAEPETDTP